MESLMMISNARTANSSSTGNCNGEFHQSITIGGASNNHKITVSCDNRMFSKADSVNVFENREDKSSSHVIRKTIDPNPDCGNLSTSPLKSRFRSVCVFCGAYSGSRNVYHDAAVALGKELVSRDIGLVYGGGSVGLMGMISKVVSDGGQQVLGVIPRTLMQAEITGQTVGKVVAVGSMHQRKAEMARLSDAFIALPGGYGTLEELLEVITWSQLGIHDKPVGLLNVDGYYDSLLAFLDNAVREGFIQASARHIFVAARNAADLMKRLEDYVAGHERVASQRSWEMAAAAEATDAD